MSIALSLGNNLTTGGIFKPTAVNNTSVNNVTDFAGIAGGGTLVLLSTQTASASANISFTTGIDSTYDEYIFKFINMHPSASDGRLVFNMSTDGGSSYNVTKTTTSFYSTHQENAGYAELSYTTGSDLAQSTAYQRITSGLSNDNDSATSATLHLFAPSSTTYVKHFMSVSNYFNVDSPAGSYNFYIGGYGNTTSAVNAVDFKFDSGNIDDGIIKMYGVAKS
jgi:hypothetical protein